MKENRKQKLLNRKYLQLLQNKQICSWRVLLYGIYILVVSFLKTHQPRKPGPLPTPGAATKTLVQAGHVTLSKIFCLVGWGKYQITCFHIQAIHFKCKERDVVVAKNNVNFLI